MEPTIGCAGYREYTVTIPGGLGHPIPEETVLFLKNVSSFTKLETLHVKWDNNYDMGGWGKTEHTPELNYQVIKDIGHISGFLHKIEKLPKLQDVHMVLKTDAMFGTGFLKTLFQSSIPLTTFTCHSTFSATHQYEYARLATNKTVKVLDLSTEAKKPSYYFHPSSENIENAIRKILKENKTIERIDLRNRSLTGWAFSRIYEALQENTTLKCIDLRGNLFNKYLREHPIENLDPRIIY